MKVHLIKSDKPANFQESVNAFIDGKKIVDIKYTSFLVPVEFTGPAISKSAAIDAALILYEEE